MGLIDVAFFISYDISSNTLNLSPRQATAEAIRRAGASAVGNLSQRVDESELDGNGARRDALLIVRRHRIGEYWIDAHVPPANVEPKRVLIVDTGNGHIHTLPFDGNVERGKAVAEEHFVTHLGHRCDDSCGEWTDEVNLNRLAPRNIECPACLYPLFQIPTHSGGSYAAGDRFDVAPRHDEFGCPKCGARWQQDNRRADLVRIS
ncbi:MAG: hypothetical protein AMXMBFR57_01480 [Acidimicrobiia bacterium]